MYRFCFILCLLSISVAGWADIANPQPQEAQPQVAAAIASAVDRMAGDIEAEPISASLDVKTFLDRTDSHARLIAVLQQGQQIGGPRWIDEQTCQVRFDISADVVRHELVQIATDQAKTSPIQGEEIPRDLKGWDGRVFSATGTSTQRIDLIRPPVSSLAWRDVSNEEILQSLTLARQDAVDHLLANISSVPLQGGKTIGDALAANSLRDSLAKWIGGRPITLVDFRDDRRVEVTLSISGTELCREFRSELHLRQDILDEKGWSDLADRISRQMGEPVGYSKAWELTVQSTQPVGIELPNQPPDWVFRQLDATGSGMGSTQLLSARAAEFAATGNLRHQIEELSLGEGHTLKDLADRDRGIAAAIQRTLDRSGHVYSVDYQSDGSVNVRMSLDLRDLWESISLAR